LLKVVCVNWCAVRPGGRRARIFSTGLRRFGRGMLGVETCVGFDGWMRALARPRPAGMLCVSTW